MIVTFKPGEDEHALTLEECNELLELERQSKTLGTFPLSTAKVKRPSMSGFEHITERLYQAAEAANDEYWNLDVSDVRGVGINVYTRDGFIPKHFDMFNTWGLDMTDKVSAVAMLTDPSEYGGGELVFPDVAGARLTAHKAQGTVIVFPAFIVHEVTRVTRGKRVIANVALHGEPWR
ncbi:2OG-Fe(II) oxygenase [Rhodococcus pyridinivorans]|uniref:2OG-Fe(II) oxygenase n=1 Tax=Rhodococcus pyridinivorans TaxID=103816 RepID=UPI001FFF80EC|nr:2OG-Fe(II) oxygenase [Rhodococcus pyridinivorans]UPK65310.1 2OG-Fe(II) oxygenase [Rhodococcus pyridinivorans]